MNELIEQYKRLKNHYKFLSENHNGVDARDKFFERYSVYKKVVADLEREIKKIQCVHPFSKVKAVNSKVNHCSNCDKFI